MRERRQSPVASPQKPKGPAGKYSDEEEERGRTRERSREPNDRPNEENQLDENELMMQMMGFSSFNTTKNKKVQKDIGGVSKVKPSTYRQYMNREGGFNRALSPPPSEKKRGRK
ncbi:hypothetical protein TRVA0_005S01200 [Trichomonascus vanleenenianus]|uniref:SNUT3/LISCH7 family protein n=1 Tax=Trichomonascus vanleenenianus TaxID=2268995 RepID=UPI003ECAE437